MRAPLALAALSLLFASASPLFAQDATPPAGSAASTATVTPSDGMSAPPSPASGATAGSAANPVACEYQEHQGQLVPMRQCVSQNEATRRRFEQQESIREFQMQGLLEQNH